MTERKKNGKFNVPQREGKKKRKGKKRKLGGRGGMKD